MSSLSPSPLTIPPGVENVKGSERFFFTTRFWTHFDRSIARFYLDVVLPDRERLSGKARVGMDCLGKKFFYRKNFSTAKLGSGRVNDRSPTSAKPDLRCHPTLYTLEGKVSRGWATFFFFFFSPNVIQVCCLYYIRIIIFFIIFFKSQKYKELQGFLRREMRLLICDFFRPQSHFWHTFFSFLRPRNKSLIHQSNA